MADTDKIVEQLSGLTVLEIAGLVKQLEEKWGVSAAAPVAVAAPPAGLVQAATVETAYLRTATDDRPAYVGSHRTEHESTDSFTAGRDSARTGVGAENRCDCLQRV